jgi:hypothetical protein
MNDSVYGNLAAECGPFPRTVSFDTAVPANHSRVLCSYTRTVGGTAGTSLTNTVTATGQETFTPDLMPPFPPQPWTITGSAAVGINPKAALKTKKCAKKKGKAKRRCKRKLKKKGS